jgi:hypothetical protein
VGEGGSWGEQGQGRAAAGSAGWMRVGQSPSGSSWAGFRKHEVECEEPLLLQLLLLHDGMLLSHPSLQVNNPGRAFDQQQNGTPTATCSWAAPSLAQRAARADGWGCTTPSGCIVLQ